MNEDEIRRSVLRALAEVAPEAEGAAIDPQESLQEQLDLDSLDFLNFVIALSDATGMEIPERDYPKVASLSGCLTYLADARATG